MNYEELKVALIERGMYGYSFFAEGQEINQIAGDIVDGCPVGLMPEPDFLAAFSEPYTKASLKDYPFVDAWTQKGIVG